MKRYRLGQLPRNLGELWLDALASDPEGLALIYENETVSFTALHDMSTGLMGVLAAHAARHGDVIAIAHEKSPLAYALMLACLRYGAPYVILDSASPVARLARIVDRAKPALLFYDDETYAQSMRELCHDAIFLEPGLVASAPKVDANVLTDAVDSATLAYIMFTSGSTGEPKGVAVPHGNVIRFADWAKSCFNAGAGSRFAQLSPMYFDNSVFDFYGGLFCGAALAPVRRKLLNSPYELATHIEECQCNMWFSVPSLLIYMQTMKALNPRKLGCLKNIVFGGEGYPKPELKKLYDAFGGQCSLTNVYGPTEGTCICSAHKICAADFDDMQGLPTLGQLLPNFDYLIADADADGAGELVLLGDQVAYGYYNDAERTEQAFSTCYLPRHYGKRSYRTGDIVREAKGNFYFVGRKDNQIKHMGYRIELEEIESALMRLPDITQACAVYLRKNDAFGKILAYAAYSGDLESGELLGMLAEYLPSYMLPARLELLAELPKNANGKVDRKYLRERAV